jgi:hypothetical protein
MYPRIKAVPLNSIDSVSVVVWPGLRVANFLLMTLAVPPNRSL